MVLHFSSLSMCIPVAANLVLFSLEWVLAMRSFTVAIRLTSSTWGLVQCGNLQWAEQYKRLARILRIQIIWLNMEYRGLLSMPYAIRVHLGHSFTTHPRFFTIMLANTPI